MGINNVGFSEKHTFRADRDLEWRSGGFRPSVDNFVRCGAFWGGPGSWGGPDKFEFACNVETRVMEDVDSKFEIWTSG